MLRCKPRGQRRIGRTSDLICACGRRKKVGTGCGEVWLEVGSRLHTRIQRVHRVQKESYDGWNFNSQSVAVQILQRLNLVDAGHNKGGGP